MVSNEYPQILVRLTRYLWHPASPVTTKELPLWREGFWIVEGSNNKIPEFVLYSILRHLVNIQQFQEMISVTYPILANKATTVITEFSMHDRSRAVILGELLRPARCDLESILGDFCRQPVVCTECFLLYVNAAPIKSIGNAYLATTAVT